MDFQAAGLVLAAQIDTEVQLEYHSNYIASRVMSDTPAQDLIGMESSQTQLQVILDDCDDWCLFVKRMNLHNKWV